VRHPGDVSVSDLIPLLLFAVNVTAPILLVLGTGVALRRVNRIDEAFLGRATWIVFNVAMPSMLFVKMVSSPAGSGSSVRMLLVGVIGTALVCALMIAIVRVLVADVGERGVVVQGAYRANMGVVGLAYCFNAFGDAGIAAVVLYLGVVTILYNVIAVVLLNHCLHGRSDWRSALVGVLRLCTGAALNFGALHAAPRNAVLGSLGKAILSPIIVVGLALIAGLDGMELVLVFLMVSAPTASASYVMVRAFGGNDGLASNIIVVSTLASIVFTSLGLMAFRLAGLV